MPSSDTQHVSARTNFNKGGMFFGDKHHRKCTIVNCATNRMFNFCKLVLNQLLENSRLIDNRLNEEDFPLPTVPKVSCIYKQENGNNTNANGFMCAKADKVEDGSEDLPLLDIPFMLVSFLLSQVS